MPKCEKKKAEKCPRCGGDGRIYIEDGVTQGQDYGPETDGHYEKCPHCSK